MRNGTPANHSALQALTAAALLLPGLASAAEPGMLNIQVSRYEERTRDLVNVDSKLPALSADSLHISGGALLRDSIRASFNLTQDTWSGATPVAVAPLAFGGNRPVLRNSAQGTVVAGASPIVNGRLPLDGNFAPAGDPRAVLIMSSASPELRRQGDLAFEVPLEQAARDAALTLGAGISDEPDYRSRYARLGGRLAFNDNLTTVSAGTAFTRSDTNALLDADLLPYLTRNAYATQLERRGNSDLLRGERRDRALELGLTQVLDAVSVLDTALTLTRASGFMENPYKAVSVIFTGVNPGPGTGDVRAFSEQRPDERRQLTFHAHYARHFAVLDGTLQLDYTTSNDDWGIDTHSIEAAWAQTLGAWTLTPRARYYTQSAAAFHTPWLVSQQVYRTLVPDPNGGEPRFIPYSSALLPAHFSSDHRLSTFGAVSGGLTAQRRFDIGLTLEAGFEYYHRSDGLRSGSAADHAYADYDFAMANIALTVDLGANARRQRRDHAVTHAEHLQHDAHGAPAGLMFAHASMPRGSFATGYRASHQRQYGALLHGDASARDADVVASGCSASVRCRLAPASMTMTMHMLDLMYALGDRTTLMVMPQYMTMDMELRALAGAPTPPPGAHQHNSRGHSTGAIGDTLVAGMFTMHAAATSSLHASLGLSIPTGNTDLEYRRTFLQDGGLQHYDMQTGSGTWDLWPTLTWQASGDAWHWGAQLSAIQRLGKDNDQGYRLGDQVQLSGWTTRALNANLSASLRAVWQQRGDIEGAFNAYNAASGPMDFPMNHGGRYVDLGLGLNWSIAGSELALEWLAPVHQEINGFQLERQGTLSASWHYSY